MSRKIREIEWLAYWPTSLWNRSENLYRINIRQRLPPI